ncbi:hypothetical protein KKI24_09320 [bacterium]|nr:hypothetical protein [bacterium]
MPNITIRDIPDVLYQDIKKLAEQERRSVNSQIIHGISEYMTRKKSAHRLIDEIKELRSSIDVKGFEPSQEDLKKRVEEGRL